MSKNTRLRVYGERIYYKLHIIGVKLTMMAVYIIWKYMTKP